MPWPEKQRVAIFLDVKRRKGLAAAKRLMHEAGYGGHHHKRKHKRPSALQRSLSHGKRGH